MKIASKIEIWAKFERGFLYRTVQKRRTPLPTTQNSFFPDRIFIIFSRH